MSKKIKAEAGLSSGERRLIDIYRQLDAKTQAALIVVAEIPLKLDAKAVWWQHERP